MDELFLRFVRGLIVVMVLYGVGMMVVVLFGDHNLGLKMLNAFSSMFIGVLGLGSGYILGRNDRSSIDKGKEDTNDRT
jgi:hypothetical protein